jgi:hypothetical protein
MRSVLLVLLSSVLACWAVINSPVANENLLTGTTDWQLTNPVRASIDRDPTNYRTPVMEGYASATSVNPGEWINFYVSTTEGFYSLEIFRMGYYNGVGGRRMLSGSFYNVTGFNQPTPSRQTANGDLLECNWVRSDLSGQSAAGSLQIPSTWVSGE